MAIPRQGVRWKFILLWVMLFHLLMSVHAINSEENYPALCATTTNLNIRTSGSPTATKIATVTTRTYLEVKSVDDNGWAQIEFKGRTAYCSARYLRYVGALTEQPSTDYISPIVSTAKNSDIWSWVILIGGVSILLIILRLVLIFVLSWLAILFFKFYRLISFPFYVLNWFQRFLAKPWRPFCKKNNGSDARNEKKRKNLEWCKIPLYIVLMPLRFINAIYYNLIVHCCFELFNYIIEIIIPENKMEGSGNFFLWAVLIPWRIIKYPLWHGSLTLIESCVWTVIDTFVPALTLFHGTDYDASVSITQGPGRVGKRQWHSGVWNVGGGNFAGNGIYFAPMRSTALHYSSGSLIVCRVSLGRTLDLGLAPKHVYNQCGHADATEATDWGLRNGYVTGEWWRDGADWWEYCMYDWQNRYNDSWRIRPLYVLNLSDETIQRIPGGMYHWLFNRLVVYDLYIHITKVFHCCTIK